MISASSTRLFHKTHPLHKIRGSKSPFFCATSEEARLAPQRMRFGPWWIFDLSSFHDFWREKVARHQNFFCSDSLWKALLKAYHIHLFSPLKSLECLALHYGTSTQVASSQRRSAAQIAADFERFSDLGIKKIEHLRQLSREGIQRRFGIAWGQLWEGVFESHKALWLWQPTPETQTISLQEDCDEPCFDFVSTLDIIRRRLESVGNEYPHLRLRSLSIRLIISLGDEDIPALEISFSYAPLLQKEIAWICKILGERLMHITLTSPLIRILLDLHPAPPTADTQLSLFTQYSDSQVDFHKRLITFTDKMKDIGIDVFEPAPLTSHLPEQSWKPTRPSREGALAFQTCFRPLFLYDAKKMTHSDFGIRSRYLKASERLAWFDEWGHRHQRHYFWMRDNACWRWIFCDEAGLWFEQGLVE